MNNSSYKIAFVEFHDYKPFPNHNSIESICHPHGYKFVTNENALLKLLENNKKLDQIFINSPNYNFLENIVNRLPNTNITLVTDLPLKLYSSMLRSQEEKYLNQIISNREEFNSVMEMKLVIDTLSTNKLAFWESIFDKKNIVSKIEIRKSVVRENINFCAAKYAEKMGLNQMTCKNIFAISEELLMNIIKDAPNEAKKQNLVSQPDSQDILGHISYGYNGSLFTILAEDPWGAFNKNKLFQYVRKSLVTKNSSKLLDEKKDGAGIGIIKILNVSHGLICSVKKGYNTQVIVLIDIKDPLRDFNTMTRSLHFYDFSNLK